MPLLGIFGRKNKSSRSEKDGPPASIYSQTSEVDSILSSPAEFGTRDRPLPSVPNGKSRLHTGNALNIPGSSKPSGRLRLFGRKKTPATPTLHPASPLYDTVESVMIPQPPYLGRISIASTLDGDSVPPPPSKAALFGAYGDPHGTLSTHSLPSNTSTSHESKRIDGFSAAEQLKKPAFFQWRSSAASPVQSNPVHTIAMEPPSPSSNQSFNLKGFRHLGPPSPTRSDADTNTSTTSLSAPIPRPRKMSTTSDASQRISVAAFREAQAQAQARRSTAGSPVPSHSLSSSNTSTSPHPPVANSRGHSTPKLRPSPSLPQANTVTNRITHTRSAERSIDSDSDESEEESEESEVDKNWRAKGSALPGRVGVKRRAPSDLGHGVPRDFYNRRPNFTPSTRSKSIFVAVDTKAPAPASQPQEPDSTVNGANLRSRASVSTSALTPNAAARRASIIAAAKANADGKGASRHSRDLSTHSNPGLVNPRASSDSEDSDDDAPLAALVGPRKPGSTTSSVTNLHPSPRPGPKPLIDINDLVGKPPKWTEHNRGDGFTSGNTLLGGRFTSSPTQEIPPVPAVVTRTPPVKFISPPSSPSTHTRRLSSSTITPTPPRPSPAADSQKSHSTASTPDTRRDMLSERLTRVVQKVGVTSAAASTTSKETPLPSPISEQMPLRAVQAALKPKPIPIPHATPATSLAVVSTPMEDLADVLGAGIKLVSRTGESSSSESEYSGSSESESEDEKKPGAEQIAPIPIRERTPPPAFSVTSRPQRPRNSSVSESAKMVFTTSTSTSTITTTASTSTTSSVATKVAPTMSKPQTPVLAPSPTNRKRSSTVVSPSSGLPQRPPESPKYIAPPSSSLVPPSSNPKNGDKLVSTRSSVAAPALSGPRPRSSTMTRLMTTTPTPSPSMFPPTKPFAMRGDSPASSTGGSSSGRAPLTPRDGSDIASVSTSSRVKIEDSKPKQPEWSGGASGLGLVKNKNHVKRRSVSFEDEPPSGDEESKRRERRRSEAKAAIELGNVINGKGPIMDDDEHEPPINQAIPRIAPVNPMMNMGMGMGMNMGIGMPMMNFSTPPATPTWGPMGAMLTPAQFIPPTPVDPALLAAHQQAMMYAKQAYQMAVAQQAMAVAADEWERGSAISGYGGGGGGGSVYGGSAYGGYGNGWSTGSMVFPNSPSSMYGGGFGSSRSEYGGNGGRQSGYSSSRSTYGESFGPDRSGNGGRSSRHGGRESTLYPPVPPLPQHVGGQRREGNSSRNSALPAAPGGPRSRTTSQPAHPSRGNLRKTPPPSSWKQAAI